MGCHSERIALSGNDKWVEGAHDGAEGVVDIQHWPHGQGVQTRKEVGPGWGSADVRPRATF